MNEIAQQLNRALEGTVVQTLLSDRGRRIYFPRGIVAQSAQAKQHGHRLNATAGIATQGGQPLSLSPIRSEIPHLEPAEIVSYAPTAGLPELRKLWQEEMLEKNPSLRGASFTLPSVVSGLTHGLSVLADLFVEPGDALVLPDLFWGNYRLIFEAGLEARIHNFPFFDAQGRLNTAALADCLKRLAGKKVILLLNFPNNPTGYSPGAEEVRQLLSLLGESASAGTRILLICDDAYFGLFYEPEIYRQSVFAEAADLHENLLAVKVDGATKENLVWGFRIGFLTFSGRSLKTNPQAAEALTQKVLGAVRRSVSNSNTLGQNLLLRAMKDKAYDGEKQKVFTILEKRYRRSRDLLDSQGGPLRVLPFNSGYFLCFDTGAVNADTLRLRLLMEEGIGTISIQERYLRVAYSSVDEQGLEELYGAIARVAATLG